MPFNKTQIFFLPFLCVLKYYEATYIKTQVDPILCVLGSSHCNLYFPYQSNRHWKAIFYTYILSRSSTTKSGSALTMLRIDGWSEYEKRETNPKIRKQNVTLKKKDVSLGVSSRLGTTIVG